MIIEISVAIAVIIFAILTYQIIKTLRALQNTLRHIDMTTLDLSIKLEELESTVHSISNLGDIAQVETEKLKLNYNKRIEELRMGANSQNDLAEWLVASIKLGSKLFSRRRSHE